MEDATSSPSDSVSHTTSTTTTTKPAPNSMVERSFVSKPRRMGRGLNDLFARTSTSKPLPAVIDPVEEVEGKGEACGERAGCEAASGDAGTDSDKAPSALTAPASAAAAGTATVTVSSPTTVDASPAANGYEYRFVQLISRLDATCNLFADARQTHLVAAQRTGKIAWSVAGVLALVAGVSLWWAGSMAAWNESKFEYEKTRSTMIEKNLRSLTEQNAVASVTNETLTQQQQALAKRNDQLQKQSNVIQSEIESIRTALSKANLVIDELMSKPEVVPEKTIGAE